MIACAVAALLLVVDPSPSPSPAAAMPAAGIGAPPTANAIYLRSMAEMRVLSAKGDPPYLVYDLQIESHNLHWYPTTTDGITSWDAKLVHANEIDAYRIWYRSKDQSATVQDAATHAAYRGDAPFAPASASMTSDDAKHATPAPSSGGGATAVAGSAKVIGDIGVAASRDYAVTLVGVEQRDGHPTYHLHLRAFRDVEDHPLTDLWVDTADYRVWSAHGEVTIRAMVADLSIGIDADFAAVGDRWLASTIAFTGKGYALFWHANVGSIMRASIIAAPDSLPDALFPAMPAPKPSGTGQPQHHG